MRVPQVSLLVFSLLLITSRAGGEPLAVAQTTLIGTGHSRGETAVGDLIADALRDITEADIAFVPAASLREENLPVGEITEESLKKLLTFPGETVSLLRLKGIQIRKALERSVEQAPEKKFEGFLQVSGITFSYSTKDKPNERVKEIKVQGAPLDNEKTFLVALPKSLANGDFGYFRIWGKEQLVKHTQLTLLQSLVSWVKKLGALPPKDKKLEKRIRVLS